MGIKKERPFAQWTDNLGGLYLYTKHSVAFIGQLKLKVPPDKRTWEGDLQRWYISPGYAGDAWKLFKATWPDAVIYPADTSSQRASRGTTTGQSWQGTYRFQGTWNPLTPQMARTGPYAVLQVDVNACPQVIRAAYKALASLYHPDKGGDPIKMQALNQAMDELKKAGKL